MSRLIVACLFLSGCYAPMQVDAPVYLCWVSDKTDVCVPTEKTKQIYDQLPPIKVKPW